MTKPTKWHVCPVKTQISLGICQVWSESSLSAWRKLGSLATHWANSEVSDWADVQADLSLYWVHSCFVGFVMRQLICINTCHQLQSMKPFRPAFFIYTKNFKILSMNTLKTLKKIDIQKIVIIDLNFAQCGCTVQEYVKRCRGLVKQCRSLWDCSFKNSLIWSDLSVLQTCLSFLGSLQ